MRTTLERQVQAHDHGHSAIEAYYRCRADRAVQLAATELAEELIFLAPLHATSSAPIDIVAVTQPPPDLHWVMHSSRQALDDGKRADFEAHYGWNIGDMRTHMDEEAAEFAQRLARVLTRSEQTLRFGWVSIRLTQTLESTFWLMN
jgi:hypothetical protein